MKKVSVIVPVYNTEKYIAKCLDSLINQSLDDIEIIVIDDGSTDKSSEIVLNYQHKYLDRIVYYKKENGGQGSARNIGIKKATGEYIGFVDSDDYVDHLMYERMYNVAVQGGYDLVECRYDYLTEDGIKKKPYGCIREYKDQKDMFINTLASPWNKLVKRELLVENEIFFPEGYIYEDTSFFLKMIPWIHSSKLIDDVFVFHIDRGDSTMNANKSKRVGHIFPVLEDAISFYQRKGYFDKFNDELEYFCVRVLFCSSMKRIAMVADSTLQKSLYCSTMYFVNKYFPNYRKNKYLKRDKTNLYIKYFPKKFGLYLLPLLK